MDQRERDGILRDLASGDDELRRLAVERLVLLAPAEALPLLAARLGDESWRVRKAAVERLAALPDPAAACPLLVQALADGENPGRRNAALESLVRLGGAVLPGLLAASANRDPDVRKQVVDALAGIAEGGAAARLVELLADPDANVRGAAADALGAVARADTAPALARAVATDSERLVRLSALRALARLECAPPLAELEGALSDSALRPAALALLGFSDEPGADDVLLKGLGAGSRAASEAAIEGLLRQIGRRGAGDAEALAARVREAALSAPDVVERALAGLESGDLEARLRRVQFLGLVRGEAVVRPLLRAGRDEVLADVVLATLEGFGAEAEDVVATGWDELDADERVLACELLGRGHSAAGTRRLLEALVQSDAVVRATAARALGRRRSPEALDALVARFEAAAEADDESAELELLVDAIATIAAPAGGEAGALAPRAVRLVGARLGEASEAFRAAAAQLLGRLGVSAESETLALLMSDESAAVRRAAVEALAPGVADVLPEPLRLACADEAAAVRIAAAHAVAASRDPRALDDLERLAADEEPSVRAAALRALGAYGGGALEEPRRLALLERGAAEGGPVAMAALETLRELGDPRAAAFALPLLGADVPELARAAVACLGRVADPRELEALLPLLGHDSWTVRAEAIRVLGERGVQRAVPALLRRLEEERDEFVRETMLRALERLER
ncbi:MAG TPA: HEAT repeat domain-containing protein [Myxococcota bacterium]|nr:HEAT repeat domain-containing protein [Myxococcota bacterium]